MHEEIKLSEGQVEKHGDTVEETAPENCKDEKESVKLDNNGKSASIEKQVINAINDHAAESGDKKTKNSNNFPKRKRRQFKCHKCAHILGTSKSLTKHQASCEVVVMNKNVTENVLPPVSSTEATQDSVLTGVHQCTVCDLEFHDEEALHVHMQIHVTKSSAKHQCFVCKSLFSRKYHLDRHVLMTPCSGRPPPTWPCEVCGKVYTRKDNLREHVRAHAGEVSKNRKHKCEYCQKKFHRISVLNIHIRTHTGEKPFKCDICEKGFPSRGALARHCRGHTGEKSIECEWCNMAFDEELEYEEHVRTHVKKEPQVDDDTYEGHSVMDRDDVTEEDGGDEDESCEDDDQQKETIFHPDENDPEKILEQMRSRIRLKMKSSVTDDFQSEKADVDDSLETFSDKSSGKQCCLKLNSSSSKCNVCGKLFSRKGNLEKHMKKHPEDSLRFEKNGHAFPTPDPLIQRSQAVFKPYRCKYCSKGFDNSANLSSHLLFHVDKRDFKCNRCGRYFSRKDQLERHVSMVHDKIRPFNCHLCDKSFGHKAFRTRHLRTHTGEKPYRCTVCTKCFSEKASLKGHLLTHTREKPCSCPVCGKAFIRRDCVIRHMRLRHTNHDETILPD